MGIRKDQRLASLQNKDEAKLRSNVSAMQGVLRLEIWLRIESEAKYVLDTQDVDHCHEKCGLVIWKDAVKNGIDVELVDTETTDEPFQGLS
jgi:hypothetical protein